MNNKAKTMAKKNASSSALPPKLRFPEYRKSAGWKATSLSSVLFEHKFKSDGKSEVHSVSLTKGVVSQMEHMGRSFSAADTSHYSLVKPFDVIYTKSPLAIFKLGIVKQHRGPHNAIVSPLYGVFSPVNRHVGQLIEAYFDSPSRSLRYLDPLAQKGAKNTIQITNERFLSGEIFLPYEEPEQQKIADCLTSVDELIAAHARKVDALKSHKKGLMQYLFPREGETQPRLRFPDFQNAGEWTHVLLKEVLTEHGLESDGKCEVHSVSVNKGIINQKEHLGRSFAAADTSHYNLAKPYDVIYTKSPTGDFPLGIVKHNQLARNVIVSPLYGVFSPENRWLGYIFDAFFESPVRTKNYLSPITQKGAKNTIQISNQMFLSKGLYLPRDPAEQQQIAECLSSVGDLIAVQTQKLDALKSHKKGLMQQLFPSQDELET
jgi:type I restriction enzyme S subunit